MDLPAVWSSKNVARVQRKLRHSRTVRRARGVYADISFGLPPPPSLSPALSPLFYLSSSSQPSCSFVRSYDHLSCFVATGRPYASRWTRTREKSHPRPGKYSALGSCPLDTTNRYSSFDMDLRVQSAAKFSRPTRIANARRLIISQIWEFQTSNVMVRSLWVYRKFSRKGSIRPFERIFALLRAIDISSM